MNTTIIAATSDITVEMLPQHIDELLPLHVGEMTVDQARLFGELSAMWKGSILTADGYIVSDELALAVLAA